jgi:hypothetical protein
MTAALWLMGAQGLLGAFDTVYFHEYRARLPAGGARTRPELWLHAVRDFIYAILFCSLPFAAWKGGFAVVLFVLILTEIVITMTDFVVEVRVREPRGVEPGERVTHGLMAIIYGAFLAHLVPEALGWLQEPTALSAASSGAPDPLRWGLALMGAGVFASGLRDMYAALGLPGGAYPWG